MTFCHQIWECKAIEKGPKIKIRTIHTYLPIDLPVSVRPPAEDKVARADPRRPGAGKAGREPELEWHVYKSCPHREKNMNCSISPPRVRAGTRQPL